MIEEIEIKNCASYDATGIKLEKLQAVNYIYGANGTGKSTISNYLASLENQSQNKIKWKDNSKLDLFVYNRKFIDDNFAGGKNQKGVFTLGQTTIDVTKSIEELKEQLKEIDGKLVDLNYTDTKKKIDASKKEINQEFWDACWGVKQKYGESFKKVFEGLNTKEKFANKCKTEISNTGDLLSLEQLNKKIKQIYAKEQTQKGLITPIDDTLLDTCKNDDIWVTKIIGKDDVDIADMIKRLNNSDWVKQGISFLSDANGSCPFCQQKLVTNFEIILNNYFDETYRKQIDSLEYQQKNYKDITAEVQQKIEQILALNNEMLDNHEFKSTSELLNSKIINNKAIIENKQKEPSSVFELDSVQHEFTILNNLITEANLKITEYNNVINNISIEKPKLIREVWRFISNEVKLHHDRYNAELKKEDKNLTEVNMKFQDYTNTQTPIDNEIRSKEALLTDITPTLNSINDLLTKYGFTGFKLVKSVEEPKCYTIVRSDGSKVAGTLSEGEKTFITFLYFYHLLQGSINSDSVSNNRVVVFDDPISSLDSGILFIVSTLILDMTESLMGNGQSEKKKYAEIKQIFILTHNVSFHYEVSYHYHRKSDKKLKPTTFKLKQPTFWILTKNQENISKIVSHNDNPIKTPYQLLWQQYKQYKQNNDNIFLANVLRRIIEYYFKHFAGIDNKKIIEQLDENDKKIAQSLLSWEHSGSHNICDGAEVTQHNNDHYCALFESIFDKMGHKAHYDMMMDSIS